MGIVRMLPFALGHIMHVQGVIPVAMLRLQSPGKHVLGGTELAHLLLTLSEGLPFRARKTGNAHAADMTLISGIKVHRSRPGLRLAFLTGTSGNQQCSQSCKKESTGFHEIESPVRIRFYGF